MRRDMECAGSVHGKPSLLLGPAPVCQHMPSDHSNVHDSRPSVKEVDRVARLHIGVERADEGSLSLAQRLSVSLGDGVHALQRSPLRQPFQVLLQLLVASA